MTLLYFCNVFFSILNCHFIIPILPWWDIGEFFWHFTAAVIPACPDASQPPSLMQQSVAGIHWALMTHSGQLVMSALFMRPNPGAAVKFFHFWITHSIFLRNLNFLFLFFPAVHFFAANPVEVAPPPPLLLLPPRAGFNRHVCRLRHEVACCPESATSHVLSLSCAFKKLYLTESTFTQENFSLFKNYWLRVKDIHVYMNTLKGSFLKAARVGKNTCCAI